MKKGLIFIIVVIMMVSLLPVAAFAEAGDFYIDSANKYEGMTDTYGSGKPYAESNGSVNIVLPLIGNIDGKDITATLDVGQEADSPFVYNNYKIEMCIRDRNYFDFVSEEQLVYFSALRMEAEKNKFMYMLKKTQLKQAR